MWSIRKTLNQLFCEKINRRKCGVNMMKGETGTTLFGSGR